MDMKPSTPKYTSVKFSDRWKGLDISNFPQVTIFKWLTQFVAQINQFCQYKPFLLDVHGGGSGDKPFKIPIIRFLAIHLPIIPNLIFPFYQDI